MPWTLMLLKCLTLNINAFSKNHFLHYRIIFHMLSYDCTLWILSMLLCLHGLSNNFFNFKETNSTHVALKTEIYISFFSQNWCLQSTRITWFGEKALCQSVELSPASWLRSRGKVCFKEINVSMMYVCMYCV